MAKSSNKNATKSFVMLIVTGVVLVAVTLCWFVINKKTSVDSLGSAVNNDASTTAKMYYGVNENGGIAVDKETLNGYKEVTEDEIKLENMVPGAEYFYKAVFESCSEGRVITLNFTDVADEGLAEVITVYSDGVKNSESNVEEDRGYAEAVALNQLATSESIRIYEKEIQSSEEAGRYFVYFSFKFDKNATIGGEDLGNGTTSVDYRNKSVTISSVDANVSSITNEETSSETNNENS